MKTPTTAITDTIKADAVEATQPSTAKLTT